MATNQVIFKTRVAALSLNPANAARAIYTEYSVTPTTVEIRSGILGRDTRSIPIRSIQSVEYRAGLFSRLLNRGALVVRTGNRVERWRGIRRAKKLQRVILTQLSAGQF
jgi:uncharacterized membrane protein YdbT with pleckstrin-like domain